MDRIAKEQRSLIMSHNRGTDTSLEILVRRNLFKRGFRFRKNVKTLPGKPDLFLKKYNTAIFVNGCFWHHHKKCKFASLPKTNEEFWKKKFMRNADNDKRAVSELRKMGYHVITIWECKLKKDFDKEMNRVSNMLYSNIEKEKSI